MCATRSALGSFQTYTCLYAGINIIMACAEGEVVQDPVVQKAALLLLCHLLGGPIVRPGGSHNRHNAER